MSDAVVTNGSEHRRVILAVRGGLLLACGALTLMDALGADQALAVAALAVVALAASIPVADPTVSRLQPVGEAVLASLVILTLEPLPETMLPYLLAPALAAGLGAGLVTGITASGMAALVLLVGHYTGDESLTDSDYYSVVARWTFIMLAVAALGSWVRRLQAEQTPPEHAAYAAAYRLLSQLRLVSRQLTGGLDPVALSQGLLEHLQRSVPFDRAAVYVRSAGGRLAPISFNGSDRLDWQLEGPLVDEAWASSEPTTQSDTFSAGDRGYSAVIPLRIGLRTFGLVAMERGQPAYDGGQLRTARDALAEQALRLETALLFSEVRTLATAEERRRLAREIHDGIAQELASLGYVVDDLAARARYLPDLEHDLRSLRAELTRVITELRLSIFDLRSEVHTTSGLGTTLSDYVRQVGAGSNLTVHLVLDETPSRLPVDSETQLLRIAQEAITNARKHANAENLWVTCKVDPPRASLCIEDDGDGLGTPRQDSFGLEVMRERAERIGARLVVRNRPDGGTVVDVSLGADGSSG